MIEYLMRPIGFTQIFYNDGEVSRAFGGGEAEVNVREIEFVQLNQFYFLSLLDAALHLYRFGRLIAESLNKSLNVLNLLALILVGTALVLESLLA